MNNIDREDSSNDFDADVEITDLDPADESDKAPIHTTHGSRIPPKARAWINLLSIIGVALLLILILLPRVLVKPSSISPAPATRLSEESTSSASSIFTEKGVVYFSSQDGTEALRFSDGSLLWHANARGFISLVADGAVYITSQNDFVDALRASNGSLLWHFTFHQPTGFLWVIEEDGIAYINAEDGTLYALRASNGAQLWQYKILSPSPPPVVVNGIVFVNAADGSGIVALRADDGAQLWQYKIFESPTQPVVVDGIVYINPQDDSTVALRASDGAQLWRYKTKQLPSWIAEVVDGTVYLAQANRIVALQAYTGSPVWSYTLDSLPSSFPVIVDRVVYVNTQDGSMYALRDGALLWHYIPHSFVQSAQAYETVFVADGIIYLTGLDGSIDALRASDGSLLWQYTPHTSSSILPQIGVGVIYVISPDGTALSALKTSDGSLLWRTKPDDILLGIGDGIIYVSTLDDSIDALWSSNGSLLWHHIRIPHR